MILKFWICFHMTKKGFTLEYQCVEALFYQGMGIVSNKKKYTITKIVGIKNNVLQQIFERKLAKRMEKEEFQPRWENDDFVSRRHTIMERFPKFVLAKHKKVSVLLLWHGTNPDTIPKIADTGFAILSIRDKGFFGKGIYLTPQADYAASVYGEKVLLLSVVIVGNVYPVVYEDMNKLGGKAHHENYDSNYVPVVPQNPSKENEDIFWATTNNDIPVYDEIVVFDESHVMPRFSVYYEEVQEKS